jgi:Flp pilus assembly secretin CpaC
MMRRPFPLALVTLVAALSGGLRAQESAPAPAPVPPRPSNQNVRIDVTIALKGDEKPVTKMLSMVTADGREAKGRAGIEVPVPTGYGPGSTVPLSYNYRQVGVNVDATPQIVDGNKVLLRLQWNFSTVYSRDGSQARQPSFGTGSTEVRGVVFDSGKPVVVAQSTDGETGREYSVEVKATILK